MFYKTQREIAQVINKLIDSYWNDEISEDFLIEKINSLYVNNPAKIKQYFINLNIVVEMGQVC